MTRLERNANITAVVVPFLGVIGAAVILWDHFLGPRDIAIFLVMYLLSALGVTVGFHRLLTHRAFQTRPWLRYTLAILGSLSLQGGVIDWVADHRKHHTFTDEDGDPHSPHAGHGAGLRGMLAGLWHAHVGWLFESHGQASSKRYARDLVEDRTMRRINKGFPLIALYSLVLPFLLGFALSGGSLVDGGLSALLWGGLVRIFLVHHITWSINSICHFFGSRRFDVDDQSTNVFWLALPSLGEAWHHNHHAFPQSAFHGLRWYEFDPSGWLILALERVGLAWDVVKVTPERAQEKLKRDTVSVNLLPSGPVKPRLRGVSHKYAFFASLACGVALILTASGGESTIAAAIYAGAVSGLLGTSALYHRITWRPRARRWMRRLDHSMIFVLIAGTYTPVALLALSGALARAILIAVWAGAGAGIVFKLVWIDAPKWLFAVVYIALGWISVAVFGELPAAIGWLGVAGLAAGGLLYTAGAIVYARERPNPVPGVFGYHEVFHALVIAAAALQYAVIAFAVLPRG